MASRSVNTALVHPVFCVQVLLMEGAGWSGAAYANASGSEACAGLVQRNDVLAFGAAVGTYLLIVLVQLLLQWLLSAVKLPVIGNLEDPCDSFTCGS